MIAPETNRNHTTVNCGVKSGYFINSFWFFVNLLCLLLFLWLGTWRNELAPPLRRPANVKSTCLKQKAVQLCLPPPL